MQTDLEETVGLSSRLSMSESLDPSRSDPPLNRNDIREQFMYGALSATLHSNQSIDDAAYNPLTAKETTILERANFYSQLKWYQKAEGEFLKLPPKNPVVVCERCICLYESGNYTQCHRVLSDFGIECNGELQSSVTFLGDGKWKDLYHLLSLLKGTVQCFMLTTACLSSAKLVLDRVRSWLKDLPTEKYGNIHVNCLRYYFILIAHITRLSFSFPSHQYTDLPRFGVGETNAELPPSSHLRVWQESLQAEGRFQDAYFVVLVTQTKSLFMGQDQEDIIPAFQSFVSACRQGILARGGGRQRTTSHPKTRQEPVWILEAYAKYKLLKLQSGLRHTSSLAEGVDLEGALAEIKQIFAGVEFFGDSNDLATCQELADYDIQRVRLQLSDPVAVLDSEASKAALVKVTQLESLAEQYLQHNNFAAADNCLSLALRSRSNVPDEEERRYTEERLLGAAMKLWVDSGDLLSYVENFLGRLPLMISRLRFGGRRLYDSQLQELQLVTGCCLSESGSFVARRLYAMAQFIHAGQIQDETMQRHLRTEFQRISTADMKIWIDESHENIGEVKEKLDTSPLPAIMTFTKPAECEDEAWLLTLGEDLSKVYFVDNIGLLPIFWGMLRELLWKDFVTGQGLEETVALILNMDLPHEFEDLCRILDPANSMDTRHEARDQLIRNLNTSTPLLCWEERFKIVKEWLLHPRSNSEVSKQPRAKREFLLMIIALERRNEHRVSEEHELCIKSTASQFELFIPACESVLRLYDEMASTMVRRFFKADIPLTHELLASAQLWRSWNGAELGLTMEERLKYNLSAEGSVTIALDQFSVLPETTAASFLPNTYCTMARVIQSRLAISPQSDFWRALWEGLSYLEKGEKLLDVERQDLASGHIDLDGLMIQRAIMESASSERSKILSLYSSAICLLWDVRHNWVHEQEHVEIVDTLIWYWVQRAKGRLLADFCETRRVKEYLVPAELRQESQTTSPELAEPKPFPNENDVLAGENTFMVALRGWAHQRLAYWETFVRDGLRRFASCEQDVILVDWYAGPLQKMEKHHVPILMTTFKIREGNRPAISTLDIRFDQAVMWLQTYRTYADEKNPLAGPSANYDLRALEPLIAPLAQLSNPGDILILCPTSTMHRIPFHALSLEGRSLIRRNPVVYTHSSWMLRHSTNMYEQRNIQSDSAIIFGNPTAAASTEKPLQLGQELCETLAQALHVTPNLEGEATKAAFTSAFKEKKSSLIHFHGHGEFDDVAPLNHGLIFAGDEILSAREIFEAHSLGSSHHVTLMACESGLGDCGGADCAIGLVPAFLCSGATSTLSTLWAVTDAHAALFAKSFYAACGKFGQGEAVDLAKALQTAIVFLLDDPEVRKFSEKEAGGEIDGEIPLYYWAAYVLHGFWLREGFEGPCE